MAINEIIKDAIKNNKEQIRITQWAVTSSVASLLYSEYLYNMKNKNIGGKTLLLVPKVATVVELLSEESQIITWLSENLIDSMIDDHLFRQYLTLPEFKMFTEDNVEIMKTILDLYILPNICKHIPATIAKKFSIGDPANQTIIESNELDLFHRQPLTKDHLDYIAHETVLQFISLAEGVEKTIEQPESNTRIEMNCEEVLSIENNNAICPIKIDGDIIDNKTVMKLLSFVTNTMIDKMDNGELRAIKEPNALRVDYLVQTGAFNHVELMYPKRLIHDPS